MHFFNAWERVRKPLLIAAYISASLVFAFFSMQVLPEDAAAVVSGLIDNSIYLAAPILAGLTYFLFGHADTIAKDLSAKDEKERSELEDEAFHHALNALQELKAEALSNFCFGIALCALLFISFNSSENLGSIFPVVREHSDVIVSIRFATMMLLLLVFMDLLKSCMTAVRFRNLLVKNKRAHAKERP